MCFKGYLQRNPDQNEYTLDFLFMTFDFFLVAYLNILILSNYYTHKAVQTQNYVDRI